MCTNLYSKKVFQSNFNRSLAESIANFKHAQRVDEQCGPSLIMLGGGKTRALYKG